MGCGSSAAPRASDEMKKEMFKFAAKETMITAATKALGNIDKVQIKAPASELGKIRDMATSLKELAEDLDKKSSGAGDAVADMANKAGAGGGMMGSVLGAVAQVADKAGSIAGGVAGKPFTLAADALTGMCNKMDEEFAKVGQQLAETKKADITAAFKKVIQDYSISQPVELVRGAAPHGPGEHKAVDQSACSKHVMKGAKVDLDAKFSEAAGDALSKSLAVDAWDKAIDKYNQTNESIGKLGDLGQQFRGAEVKLDIKEYIVEQLRLELAKMMSTEEETIRKDPKGHEVRPKSFELLMSSPAASGYTTYDAMTTVHYDNFTKSA